MIINFCTLGSGGGITPQEVDEKIINALVNYYTINETYNREEINALIADIPTWSIEVVDELPESGVARTIYFVPNTEGSGSDLYDEYIWINNKFEHLGTARIDLSQYYTKTETDAAFVKKSDIVDNLDSTDANKPISARAVNVDMVNYVDASISDTLAYVDQQDNAEHAGRVAGDNLINSAITEMQEVTSRALNALQTNKADKSEIPSVEGLASEDYVDNAVSGKQDTLIAGTNITIEDNVISATGGGDTDEIEDVITTAFADINTKIDDNHEQINAKADGILNTAKVLVKAEKVRTDSAIEKSDEITAAGVYYSVKSEDDSIKNIVKMTQAQYDSITPDEKTFYIIINN